MNGENLPTWDGHFSADLLEWGRHNIRSFPWRSSNATIYEFFVSEFLLQRTTAEAVREVYPTFIERYPSLESIDRADKREIEEVIEPLGLQRKRARALKEIASEHSRIPEELDNLLELPQVGRYVANATFEFSYGEGLPLVDANVRRVYTRLFGDDWPEGNREQLRFAEELLPDQSIEYNRALLDFGGTVCKPTPRCENCFATEYCSYYSGEPERSSDRT